ncbi:cytochrome c biogenesis protein ResB [Castellaniella sp.]|uniref:cytochrome c biogenesis protein ResB n=1 Tax=Castellaniella sp. TaxID=1955812 RepID=UPI002AFF138F|nr:cytochrome c biogenesis protein ResB [Castellaniella sp.]
MRFAISLLMFICIASLIGTVLPQNQASNAYIDQFGPFWFAVFDQFSIWHIYNSPWFLLIMAFLVVSTSLCVMRNTPKMLRDMRTFREYVRGSSLKAFHHKLDVDSALTPDQAVDQVGSLLRRQGFRYRVRVDGDSRMVAAKKGAANRLGYIFAHVAIVVICLGGLLDSELPVRLQTWLFDKQPIMGNMLISEVPESGRLSMRNPSFRANMLLPDGKQSSMGIIAAGQGVLLQPLPFTIRLKKFYIDYYDTGMPSDFRSDVVVTDLASGHSFEQTIQVNEPLHYQGVTVYQSSFDDGGSGLSLKAWPLSGPSAQPQDLSGVVGQAEKLPANLGGQTIDYTGLRIINVENLGDPEPQPKDLVRDVAAVTGSAVRPRSDSLRNVGPSVQYRLVGADGQAHEFTQYMLPVKIDDFAMFLLGTRNTPAEAYRYLRIPADDQGTMQEFMQLRAALTDPALRDQAARQFAAGNAPQGEQRDLMFQAAQGALRTFSLRGFNGILDSAPADQREKIMNFAVPMIQISLHELRVLMRDQQGLPALATEGELAEQQTQWLRLAVLALASLPDYPAAVALQLSSFDQVQASVFQVARSPGKTTVYIGCLLLVLGIFSMFYIRERRVWVWIRPSDTGSSWLAAMTTQRRNMDFTHEFERLSAALRHLGGSRHDH